MGREIKRVPLDFNWPINVVWGGFLNPFCRQSTKCPPCDGLGYSPEYNQLTEKWYGNAPFRPEDRGSVPFTSDNATVRSIAFRNVDRAPDFYGLGTAAVDREANRLCELYNNSWSHHLNDSDVAALIAKGRLMDFTHAWTKCDGWKVKTPTVVPTAREVNEWSLVGFGHDSTNAWICAKAECKRLGVDPLCAHCKGDATIWPSPKIKRQYDRWKATEPPAGDGYQLWETVSDGSPISPVFAAPEELADWLTDSADYKWRKNDEGTTRDQWLKFIKGPGWALTLVQRDGVIQTGVQACV